MKLLGLLEKNKITQIGFSSNFTTNLFLSIVTLLQFVCTEYVQVF